MNTETVQLWCATPKETAMRDGVPSGPPMLSEEELDRLRSFRFDDLRREYATSRLLTRTALSHLRQGPPAGWRFRTNSYGKPSVEPACGVEFNISNCPSLVVCLLAEGTVVGVDAEPYERAGQILDLADDVFSAEERAQLKALAPAQRHERVLSLWTLKEAYTKGLGLGLSLPLRGFSFLFDGPEELHFESATESGDRANDWKFALLDHAGHRIAIAARRITAPELEIWELQPTQGTARLLPSDPIRWYPAG